MEKTVKVNDPTRGRTWNLWFRRPAPYPLGHRTILMLYLMKVIIYNLQISKTFNNRKIPHIGADYISINLSFLGFGAIYFITFHINN